MKRLLKIKQRWQKGGGRGELQKKEKNIKELRRFSPHLKMLSMRDLQTGSTNENAQSLSANRLEGVGEVKSKKLNYLFVVNKRQVLERQNLSKIC